MNNRFPWILGWISLVACAAAEMPAQAVYPAAVLDFQPSGNVGEQDAKIVTKLVTASLSGKPGFVLVERSQLDRLLDEAALNLSGVIEEEHSVKLGHLVGARILVYGSIVDLDSTMYLTAKIVGVETGRVLGTKVQGDPNAGLADMCEQLAEQIAKKIEQSGSSLIIPDIRRADQIVELNNALGQTKRPSVRVSTKERHIGQPSFDPAVETTLMHLLKETGFQVVDREARGTKADVEITGEGFSEFAMRMGDVLSVKARVELKAVHAKTGRVLAAESTSTVVLDISEHVAGKKALEEATRRIAGRLIPKLIP